MATGFSAFSSVAFSLLFCFFLPFFFSSYRLGFAAGEAGPMPLAPGEAKCCLKSQEIHALGDGPHQPEPDFFVSGCKECILGRVSSPELASGGSAQLG